MLVSTRRCTCWISSKVTFLVSSLPSASFPFPRSSTVAVPPASFLAPTDALFRVRAVAPRLEAACAAAELAELRPPGVGRNICAAFAWSMPKHVETYGNFPHVAEADPPVPHGASQIQRSVLARNKGVGRIETKRIEREGGWSRCAVEETSSDAANSSAGMERRDTRATHVAGRARGRGASLAWSHRATGVRVSPQILHSTKRSLSEPCIPRRGPGSHAAPCR